MPNPYYNTSFNASLGSLAQSRAVDFEYEQIERGFDLLYQLIRRSAEWPTWIGSKPDVPLNYVGSARKIGRVNVSETAFEFVTAGSMPIKVIAATVYTLIAADAGYLLLFTAATPVTVTVPQDVFPQETIICARQKGAGQVTFVPAGAGVTLTSSDNLFSTRKQHAQVALICDGANDFCLIGERNAASLGGFALLLGGNDFQGAQNVRFVQLPASSGTLNTNAALSNHFYVTLTGNSTLAFPTNLRDGVILNWQFRQDATGGRTLAFDPQFRFFGGTAPTASTAANVIDGMTCQYNAGLGVMVCSYSKGA